MKSCNYQQQFILKPLHSNSRYVWIMVIIIKDDDSIHEADSQEHLCLMGVPAYAHLAADVPYPPFHFADMPDGVIKRLSGNAACLFFLYRMYFHIQLQVSR